MAVTSGFFNSQNGDRKYSAEQFSALFNNLITDGVFANVGTAFEVKAAGENNITIGVGRAWFNSVWVYNDTLYPMVASATEVLLDRIDAIVMEINHNEAVRAGSIRWVYGVPSSEPSRPALTNTDEVHQYPLAYIYRSAGDTQIIQADITNMIGTSACPYVTGILSTQNIDKVVAQWESEFTTWFDGLDVILSGDAAANIANQILDLQGRFQTLAKEKAVYDDLLDSDGDTIEDNNGLVILGKTALGGGSGEGGELPSDYIKTLSSLEAKVESLNRYDASIGNEYLWARYSGSTLVGFVNSTDQNAYPPVENDGYSYVAIGKIGQMGLDIDSLNTLINQVNTTLDTKINTVNSTLAGSISSGDAALDTKINNVNSTLTNSINSVNSTLSGQIAGVNQSISSVNTNLTNSINGVNANLSAQIAGKAQFVLGSYVGNAVNGYGTQTINLGFTPRVVISSYNGETNHVSSQYGGVCFNDGRTDGLIWIVANGFCVKNTSGSSWGNDANMQGFVYRYMAFI